jgi:small subunit ribosomal protein S21
MHLPAYRAASLSKNCIKRGNDTMSEVRIGDNENFEAGLKRFTRKVQQDGILGEARRRSHYESPNVRRKKKAAAHRRKNMKKSKSFRKA